MECFICCQQFELIQDAVDHVKSEYLIPENGHGFSLECLFKLDQNCTQKFLSYFALKRHCILKHQVPAVKRKLDHAESTIEAMSSEPSVKRAKTDVTPPFTKVTLTAVEAATQSIFIQMEAAGVSEAQQTLLAEGLLKLVSAAGQYTLSNVASNVEVPLESLTCSTRKVLQNVQTFQSSHLRQKFYSSLPTFVPPVEKAISLRTRRGADYAKGIEEEELYQTSFQYVPIKDTLKAFFKIPEFRNQWFNQLHTCTPGIYYDFCCAQNCQESEFFKTNPLAGKCQLYYDECEPCDGLKSRGGVHKLGLFYIKWHNIDPALRSRMNNSQLAAIAYYDDIKNGKIITLKFQVS